MKSPIIQAASAFVNNHVVTVNVALILQKHAQTGKDPQNAYIV